MGSRYNLPILEHTSNQTGRLLVYSLHKRGAVYHLLKDVILEKGEVIRDKSFLFSTLDHEKLHREMIFQGFVPFNPATDDDPAIVMTYL